jgi:hypothetical protein
MVVLDQEKFYDRLLLSTLGELGRQIGLDEGDLVVLWVYRYLRRQLWLDGAPTRWAIAGGHLCGIPQGCPYGHFGLT